MSSNLVDRLKKAVEQALEASSIVENPELRKIAFENLLKKLIDLALKIEAISPTKEEKERTVLEEKLSLPEFISKVDPKTNPERITCILHYLKHYENTTEATLEDVLERFKEAALKRPANPRRDLRAAIQKGWVSPSVDKEGFYYITRTGESLIENKLKETE